MPNVPAAQLAEEERAPSIVRVRNYELPPIGGDPLYWKEMSLGYTPFYKSPVFYTMLGIAGYVVVSVFLSVLVGAATDQFTSWTQRVEVLSHILRGLGLIYGMLLCFGMGFFAAGAVARERQAKTLDSLLTMPIDRRAILGAKWLASLNRNLGWLFSLAMIAALGLITGSLHVSGAMLLTAAPVIHAAFFASLGLYLSVVCRTTLEAYVKLAVIFFVITVASWLLGVVLDWAGLSIASDIAGVGLNPAWSWWTFGFSYPEISSERQRVLERVSGCLGGLCVYMLAAIAFWFLACRAFQKETYRHVE
jgi:ABC-type transport system involved in multi-copper enzyme maturation permease subunit